MAKEFPRLCVVAAFLVLVLLKAAAGRCGAAWRTGLEPAAWSRATPLGSQRSRVPLQSSQLPPKVWLFIDLGRSELSTDGAATSQLLLMHGNLRIHETLFGHVY